MANDLDHIRSIKSFPSLIKYLRDDLGWEFETDDVEELIFEYEPEELGLDAKTAVKIKEIKQLRPLVTNQPWGIFYINFEPKRLPVVVLRRILRSLVIKKRASANRGHQAAWKLHDLLFISSYGESDERAITFAHFSDNSEVGDLPTLKVLGWDAQDTVLHLEDAHRTLREKLRFPDDPSDVEAWREQWSSAFTLRHREVVTTSIELAKRLAELATLIRERANRVLAVESEKGAFRRLHEAFKEALIHDLSADDFADMYAQTIAYGLLSARVSRPAGLVADNLVDMVPSTNPFLKELLGTFLKIGGRDTSRANRKANAIDFDELGINEIVELLRRANMEAVLRDFGNRNPTEDPVIHFYELFLKEYDPVKRMKRGVFYTPRPVVSFIVRSVDEILRREFKLEYGLADTTTWREMTERHEGLQIPEGVSPDAPFVQVLDPATGTSTFIVETIDLIYNTMVGKWRGERKSEREIRELWNDYVPKHLLPRVYGFELMMAPYAIAHMKVGLKLYETGYGFLSSERARIYLTNTLEEPKDFSGYFAQMAPALAHEAAEANAIKRHTPITVIIGNPPYSAVSANLTPQARSIVDEYRYVNGQRIRERSMLQFEKNIQDDYIKFIAKAQKITKPVPLALIGFVTNHSYLDGPTLRGMRWNLITSFSQIDVVDLHGNSNKKETAPDGSKDENVFDIQQGVAVSLMRRVNSRPSETEIARVRRGDLWGSRDEKTDALGNEAIQGLQLNQVNLNPEYYFFVVETGLHQHEWDSFIPLTSMFKKYSTGTETGFDELLMDIDKNSLIKKVRRFADTNIASDVVKKELGIKGGHAAELLSLRSRFDIANQSKYVRPLQFRPFDYRYAYLKKELLKTNSFNVMEELGAGRVGLVTTRQTKERFGVLAVAGFCGHKCTSSYDRSYVFPLWISDSSTLPVHTDKRTAITPETLSKFASALNLAGSELKEMLQGRLPEQIFYFTIAILSAPSYNVRYGEQLKRDFPRIPLTTDHVLFNSLCQLGANVVALHLLDDNYADASWNINTHKVQVKTEESRFPRANPFASKGLGFHNGGSVEVVKGYPKYEAGKIHINPKSYFTGVNEAVWQFHVGGFQVTHNWLKDRRERLLTQEDIVHFTRTCHALASVIEHMSLIDEVIEAHGGFPLVGSQNAAPVAKEAASSLPFD